MALLYGKAWRLTAKKRRFLARAVVHKAMAAAEAVVGDRAEHVGGPRGSPEPLPARIHAVSI